MAGILRGRGGLNGRPCRTTGIVVGAMGGAPLAWSVGRGAHTPPNRAWRLTGPGHGGMRACRPTRSGGGAVEIAGLSGRPYRPPLRRTIGLVRRAGCPHPAKPGLAVNGARSWRHEGMPPYEVRRGCGGNRGPVRAGNAGVTGPVLRRGGPGRSGRRRPGGWLRGCPRSRSGLGRPGAR